MYNYNSPQLLSIYENIKYSITEIAVPLFFLISGFNFFRNYSHSSYKRKFKSRIKSLLVPYLVWNTIFCGFCIIISTPFFEQYFIGREKFIVTPINVLWGIVFHNNCNSQFWFVFELIVCVLMNPLIYYILKNRITGVLLLSSLFVAITCFGFNLPEYFFYRTDAFLYYYIGAFLGIHFNRYFLDDKLLNIEAKKEKRVNSDLIYIVVGILLICSTLLLLLPNGLQSSIRAIIIIIGAYGFWRLSLICEYYRMSWLPQGGTTFLMYAAHGIIQPIVVKVIYLALPKDSWMSIVNLVLAISITVLLIFVLRYLTKHYIPIVDKVITGWRR